MMPYYEAPEMLKRHLSYWHKYPKSVLDRVRVVIVDDGSPNVPAEDILKETALPGFPISLYRIKENIPWNHGGARNLGMHVIDRQEWVVGTDIDLVLTADNVIRLLSKNVEKEHGYRFTRKKILADGSLETIKVHRESFLMTSERFWMIGGFDEDFSGYWNGPFIPFFNRISMPIFEDVFLLCHSGVLDSTVREWGRGYSKWDIKSNPELLAKRDKISRRQKPKNPLRFTWEQVL